MTKKLGLQVKIKGNKLWHNIYSIEIGSHVGVSVKGEIDMDFNFYEWDDVLGFRSTNPKLFEKK